MREAMRGEKPVTLDEVSKICVHYQISLDQLMNIQTNAFVFFGKNVNPKNFSFNEYLGTMLEYMFSNIFDSGFQYTRSESFIIACYSLLNSLQ